MLKYCDKPWTTKSQGTMLVKRIRISNLQIPLNPITLASEKKQKAYKINKQAKTMFFIPHLYNYEHHFSGAWVRTSSSSQQQDTHMYSSFLAICALHDYYCHMSTEHKLLLREVLTTFTFISYFFFSLICRFNLVCHWCISQEEGRSFQ